MPRYSLSQLFSGTALIAIILAFTQTEGCGTHYTMIETLSFSSDGSRIAVSKLNARDARTPLKAYKANLSRTLCWLDVSDGRTREIIRQDFKLGNCGPALQYWQLGRTSALCNPSNDRVAMSAFGGGDVTLNVDTARPIVVPLQHGAYNVAYSTSGRFLAASGMEQLTVLDTESNTVVMRVRTTHVPFLGATLMAFTSDETCIVIADDSNVHVWNIASSTRTATVIQDLDPWIHAIAVAPDNTLIVCSDRWVRRYDLAGKIIATLGNNEHQYLCNVSADGNSLAVCDQSNLKVYDLSSNNLQRTLSFDRATALALSADGSEIAVGDSHGHVALIDTTTGNRRWYANPPSRYRWPWTLPATLLAGWCFLTWRLSKQPRSDGNPSS